MSKTLMNSIDTTTRFMDVAQRGERSVSNRAVGAVEPIAMHPESESGERGFMRPSHDVRVRPQRDNAVLVQSPTRLNPGMRTELQLLEQRRTLSGEIEQCRITGLEPLCYEAVFVFHHSVEMPETNRA